MIDGLLPVNKPSGISSYDVIRKFKRSGFRGKIGHAGTLDPFASGVLLLLLGKTTKRFDEIQKWRKVYVAKAVLGARSETLDVEGEIIKQSEIPKLELKEVEKVMKKFMGEIEQEVPAYSAAKHKGRPMYKLAREGVSAPRKSKIVTIYELELKEFNESEAEIKVSCSSGTYIRQLSWDIFRRLGVDSYLVELERAAIGEISLSRCCEVTSLIDGNWINCLIY